MTGRFLRSAACVGIVALLATGSSALPAFQSAQAHAFSYATMTSLQKRLLSGFASYELHPPTPTQQQLVKKRNVYFPTSASGCPTNLGSNVKVNQDCLNVSDPDLQGRAQAQNETSIALDPFRPSDMVAGYNDYRLGDGTCGISYSRDGGRSWTDSTIPRSFTRGTAFGAARQYWQAGGDPSVAWDTRGNAYYSCQVFNRGAPPSTNPDLSSAVYVFRSTLNGGASWNFPGRPVIESADIAGTGAPPFEDKPYMTVDNHVSSPFRDRVYVTWTEFASDGTAYIYESHSSDYGETFSPKVLVSTPSSLCPTSVTTSGACDANQDSQPFVGPDGALYVVYNNFNNSPSQGHVPGGDVVRGIGATQPITPVENFNQILLAKSTDGGVSFSAPVLVSDFYDLPDCATYQNGKDAGRACVPEKGGGTNSYFRASNYPSGAVNPTNLNQVVVTFGSYINVHSNESNGCTPTGFATDGGNTYDGVKLGRCNNDILLSVSNDGGATFTGASTNPRALTSITNAPAQATTDQFWQWAAFTTDGRLAVSYYDRQYGFDEVLGFSDISLSGSSDLTNFGVTRVTSSSMPPETEFEGDFLGDYSGLTASTLANPLWSDSRALDLFLCPNTGITGTPPALCVESASNATIANDEDVYTAGVAVPAR